MLVKNVNGGVVLDAAPGANDDPAEIAPDDRVEPDAGIVAYGDIADQNGRGRDKNILPYCGRFAFKFDKHLRLNGL